MGPIYSSMSIGSSMGLGCKSGHIFVRASPKILRQRKRAMAREIVEMAHAERRERRERREMRELGRELGSELG